MTDNKLPEKYNDSCIKMFQLIKMMTEDCADYDKVIELFSTGKEGKNNPTVILNKYLNTLKIFGLKIKKHNKKFYLLNPPLSLEMSAGDIEAVNLLSDFMEVFPNGKNKKNFLQLLKKIEAMIPDNMKSQLLRNSSDKDSIMHFKFYFSEYEKLIEECENYCTEKFKLKIHYVNTKNEEETIIAIPQEVKYHKSKICFSVFNTATNEIHDIPLNEIKRIEQFPTKSGNTCLSMTVVYKLKSRLAKTYKLKEGETSKGLDENGHLVIVNKNEDHRELLKRLMRYGFDCEVISPKSFKAKMKDLINNTLANYKQNQ